MTKNLSDPWVMRVGADNLAAVKSSSVGASYYCLDHNYLSLGKGLVLVQDRGHIYYACLYCLGKLANYKILEAEDA